MKVLEKEPRNILLETILDSTDDCIKVLNREAALQFMNNGGLKKLEICDYNSIHGKCWFDFWEGESQVSAKRVFASALSGKSDQFSGELRRTGKPVSSWDVVAAPIRDENGEVTQVLVTSRDVTQRLLSQKERDRTLDQIFAESHSFMTILSVPEFRYLRTNAQHLKLIRKANILGKTITEVEPELKTQGIIDLLNHVVETGKPFIGTEIPIHYDPVNGEPAKTSYLDFIYQPLRDPEGNVYAIAAQGYDVTEKVLSRAAVEEAKREVENERENFRHLFRQTPEMVCMLKGPDHVFEFVNHAHIKALGFDATGKSVREAQPESVEVHGILDDVYRTGKTAELREIPVTVTDRLRYFNLTYSARKDISGKTNGVMILGTEVTAQVLNRHSLEKTARLIESMPAPFFAMDAKWEIIYWNPAAAELIGFTKEQVLGRIIWDIFPGLEDSPFGENYRRAMAEKRILNFEAHYPQYKRWYRVWPFPFEDGIAVTFLDVTDRKVIEEELERSKERYQVLFDSSPLPKWILDPETMKFLDVNRSAIEHYGYSKDEFLSMTAKDIRPPGDVEYFLKMMKEDFSPEGSTVRRMRHRKKNGEIIEVDVSAIDLNLDGRIARIGAIVDVTDRVAAEAKTRELMESLTAAKEEAERANELKSAFLANMSHEIRTPLGAMVGFADLLRDPGLSRETHSSYINILTRNGEQLATIIDDILDLSKVEAGHLTLEFDEASPDEIAADVVSLLRVKANEKDIALDFRAEVSTPSTFVTDSLRLRQILMNVVGNAIKFTPSGSVKVRSFGADDKDSGRTLYFEVADTGIGIPEREKERIFESFVQANGTLVRRFGGTGLGLALSRQLARHLGGDVSVTKTAEGGGSTFLISVQDQPSLRTANRKRTNEVSLIEPTENILKGIKVLVVDDSEDNRQLIWHFLTKYGALVDFAENGHLGFRKALAGDFDVVLMDIQMPDMDGYTATLKLRESGYLRPVIALTAHAMTEVRKRCLNVGCNDHLSKPIKLKELLTVVARFGFGPNGNG